MVSCDFVLWLDDIAFAGFVRKHPSAGALVYQQSTINNQQSTLNNQLLAGFVRKHLSAGALVYQQCKQTFWRRLQVISTLLTFADSDMWAEKIANVFF